MQRMLPVLLGLLALGISLSGCRNVWVHPQASEEKWTYDSELCDGMPKTDTPAKPSPPEGARSWKQCMLALGWSTETDSSVAPLYRKPTPPIR